MTMRTPDDLRREWVARVMGAPGMEILAVQTLRNSIMAATVMASTSALAIMGLLGLGSTRGMGLSSKLAHPAQLAALLAVALLAACVVQFSSSVRLYHRCSYLVALTGGDDPQRRDAQANAAQQLLRASRLYRGGWWTFYGAMASGVVAAFA
jgi:hypothetical protein